jgi:hypothetical protein
LRRRGWGNRRGGRNGGGRGNSGGRGDGGGRSEGSRGEGGGSPRLLERLRDLRGVSLREVRALELSDVPSGVALGAARGEGNRPVAIVASSRDGLDLLGWARIAARRAGERPLHEVYVAAPFFSARTRAAAERAAERGPILHLLTLPSLAEPETFALESFPPRAEPSLLGGGAFLPVHWGTFSLAMHAWDDPAETLLQVGPKRFAPMYNLAQALRFPIPWRQQQSLPKP